MTQINLNAKAKRIVEKWPEVFDAIKSYDAQCGSECADKNMKIVEEFSTMMKELEKLV